MPPPRPADAGGPAPLLDTAQRRRSQEGHAWWIGSSTAPPSRAALTLAAFSLP